MSETSETQTPPATDETTRPPPARSRARSDRNRTLGAVGERIAARHLEEAGLEILDRNWRCAGQDVRGELDIVARDGTTVVIVEVKARLGGDDGQALAAVDPAKVAQVRRLAAAWLAASDGHADEVRIDVIGVTWQRDGRMPTVEHLSGVG